ncbi:hypothetical protein LSAT2_014325 [Lamellibrachia satsuma]|nr:hypothetical protein LSAT2_014325 [Lamellibrachia satsuma]
MDRSITPAAGLIGCQEDGCSGTFPSLSLTPDIPVRTPVGTQLSVYNSHRPTNLPSCLMKKMYTVAPRSKYSFVNSACLFQQSQSY